MYNLYIKYILSIYKNRLTYIAFKCKLNTLRSIFKQALLPNIFWAHCLLHNLFCQNTNLILNVRQWRKIVLTSYTLTTWFQCNCIEKVNHQVTSMLITQSNQTQRYWDLMHCRQWSWQCTRPKRTRKNRPLVLYTSVISYLCSFAWSACSVGLKRSHYQQTSSVCIPWKA